MPFATDDSVRVACATTLGFERARALALSIAANDAAAHEDARRRLMRAGLESDAWGAPGPARPGRRIRTLVPTSSAAVAVGLLVLELFLGQGSLA